MTSTDFHGYLRCLGKQGRCVAAVLLVVGAMLITGCCWRVSTILRGCVAKRDERKSQFATKRAVTAATGYGTATSRCSSGVVGRVRGTFSGARYAAALVVADLVDTAYSVCG